jgi:hypothetical protein
MTRINDDGIEGKKLFLIGGVGNNGISRSIKMWEMSDKGNWVQESVNSSLIIQE